MIITKKMVVWKNIIKNMVGYDMGDNSVYIIYKQENDNSYYAMSKGEWYNNDFYLDKTLTYIDSFNINIKQHRDYVNANYKGIL